MALVVARRIPIAEGFEEDFEKRWRNRKWSLADPPPEEAFAGPNALEIHEVIASKEASG